MNCSFSLTYRLIKWNNPIFHGAWIYNFNLYTHKQLIFVTFHSVNPPLQLDNGYIFGLRTKKLSKVLAFWTRQKKKKSKFCYFWLKLLGSCGTEKYWKCDVVEWLRECENPFQGKLSPHTLYESWHQGRDASKWRGRQTSNDLVQFSRTYLHVVGLFPRLRPIETLFRTIKLILLSLIRNHKLCHIS